MVDEKSARKVDVVSFEAPSSDTRAHSSKKPFPWHYLLVVLLVAILLPGLSRFFELLQPVTVAPLVVSAAPEFPDSTAELSNPQSVEDSPFADALMAEARSKSQEILAEFLPIKESLEIRQVADWAEADYANLQILGDSGDEFYQRRKFDEALQKYKEALELAKQIEAQSIGVAAQLVEAGYAALQENNAQSASEKFQLALAIDSDDLNAQSGLQKSAVLNEVVSLLQDARNLLDANQLKTAKVKVDAALALDPEFDAAIRLESDIANTILQSNFQQQMSQGYQGLAAGNFAAAENAFRLAEKMMPGGAATEGLAQLEAARQADKAAVLMQEAKTAEAAEQWLQAQQTYQKLIEENPASIEPRVALVQVAARLKLDQKILETLENPLALRDEQKWQSAQENLTQASAIKNRGPRLETQITRLAETLRKARTPVRLQILSDGATNISVLGIAELGMVRNHPLDLNPGTYVIIGKKRGYQDVRQEVVVSGDQEIQSIEITPSRSLEAL